MSLVDDAKNLKPDQIHKWPVLFQALGVVGLLVVGGVIFYFLVFQSWQEQSDGLRGQEVGLISSIKEKKNKVANLPLYLEQLEEIEARFKELLRQLPKKAEIPSLLDEAAIAGRGNDLEFQLFQPQGEIVQKYFAEVPVKISLSGHYHDMGQFASDIAQLERIVSLHNLRMSVVKGGVASGKSSNRGTPSESVRLSLEGTLKTYRYLEESEETEG